MQNLHFYFHLRADATRSASICLGCNLLFNLPGSGQFLPSPCNDLVAGEDCPIWRTRGCLFQIRRTHRPDVVAAAKLTPISIQASGWDVIHQQMSEIFFPHRK
ncbi:unnamed protein product, partial [Nesidiocoris tenuis]